MKANSEIMLMETSNLGKAQMPAAKEMGIPKVTQKARRTLRNSPNRMLTRIRPIAIFLNKSSIRLRRIVDLSL